MKHCAVCVEQRDVAFDTGGTSEHGEFLKKSSPVRHRVISLLFLLLGISTGNQVQGKVDNGLIKEPILDFLLGPF